MNTKARIASILNANCLDESVTGLPTFRLSNLHLAPNLDFKLPTNVRLGHLAEKVVSELIKLSSNYTILNENIQITEAKNTIGEIDFIVKEIITNQLIHLELAYKFYLFDPSISSKEISNWIGPNRNDSLIGKLGKLKRKQFPLLYHNRTKLLLPEINTEEVSQALCLLVSLFVPFDNIKTFDSAYSKAIKGYYLNFEAFTGLDNAHKSYFFPPRKEWGMHPSENETWANYSAAIEYVKTSLNEKQAVLCWQKHNNSYSEFFIVWW